MCEWTREGRLGRGTGWLRRWSGDYQHPHTRRGGKTTSTVCVCVGQDCTLAATHHTPCKRPLIQVRILSPGIHSMVRPSIHPPVLLLILLPNNNNNNKKFGMRRRKQERVTDWLLVSLLLCFAVKCLFPLTPSQTYCCEATSPSETKGRPEKR